MSIFCFLSMLRLGPAARYPYPSESRRADAPRPRPPSRPRD
jgi:hypothetical protein